MRRDVTRVLLVEDDADDARRIRACLGDAAAAHLVSDAGSLAAAEAWLAVNDCDAVLLDLTLPDCLGIETIKRMVRLAPTLPVVVLATLDDPDFALLAVEVGAQDCVLKAGADPAVLTRALRYAVLRKELEEYARLASARVRSMIELAHDAIVAVTPDQRIVMVNPAAERLFGWPEALLTGRPLDVLVPGRYRSAHALHVDAFTAGEAASRNVAAGRELFGLHRDGHEIPVEITVSRTPSPEGLLFTAIIRDVTQRKRAEAELRTAKEAAEAALVELSRTQRRLIEAEKLSALGHLVAGLAHEVNTPVGNALTSASFLTDRAAELRARLRAPGGFRRGDLETFLDQVDEAAGIVLAAMQRAGSLVQLFKQTAADRAGPGRCRFRLDRLLTDFVEANRPLVADAGHALVLDCPDRLEVNSHPVALTQLLTNLLANALAHAFPDGRAGRLTLSVSEEAPDGRLRLVFADDGVGIPEEALPKVFEPFFTTTRHAGSTGLGLSIAYSLATGTLGGRLAVASAPGEGTRFTLKLPRSAPD